MVSWDNVNPELPLTLAGRWGGDCIKNVTSLPRRIMKVGAKNSEQADRS